MIPQEMATVALAQAKEEIAIWERRVARQRFRVESLNTYGIEHELSWQILQTFEAALKTAYERRDRLLDR